MEKDIRDDDRRKVTSVGNSWIVCKSRSHSGHVYYFNTLTGEAAWNLSDAEIEKAKTRTRILERQPGGKPTRCPEPKDNPPNVIVNKSVPAQISFDEPMRINTVSEQQHTTLAFPSFANNDTFHHAIDQMSGAVQRAPINNLPRENTIHNTISTLKLNTAPIYNPMVWAVPHAQPVFIAPTMNPIVSHPQAALKIAFNNLSHTVLQPPSWSFFNRYDNANQSSNTMRGGIRKFFRRHFNYGQNEGSQQNYHKKNDFTNKNDLREKLSAKKRFSNIPSGTPRVSGLKRTKPRRNDTSAHNACTPEEIHASDLHESTLENRSTETQLHEGPSKIDLGPLKSLAPSDSNPDAWFIVVDLDILLNEFKLLNTLTDSDENCHLMVPAQVMSQLKDYVTCTENIQARRILRFLSQQIEIGYAFMAEDPSDVKGDSLAEVIHSTCIELSARKYHLILLTNNNEILGIKDNSNIKMFSIDEIKKLLMDNPNTQPVSVPKQPFIFEGLIKIIVPNDTPQDVDTSSTAREIELDEHTEKIPVSDDKTKEKHVQDKTVEPIVVKRTADAGIQTDFEDINASISMPNVTEKQGRDTISNTPQITNETIIRRPAHSVFNMPDRRREIKLKRSTFNQPTVPFAECNEKKQFKWRRRRNTTPQASHNTPQTPAHNDQRMQSKKIENLLLQSPHKEICKEADKLLNKTPLSSRNENKTKEDSIESRESSIIFVDHKSSKENVTIEETSTSGIISNTESNVDAESNYSMSTDKQQTSVHKEHTNVKPMYEIESISMEDNLKIKCDEWVSRFIQIMEEVLSQVLQQDPPFSHSAIPAPWTLHEAAQCVAIKFSSYQDIKDAANRLSNILLLISDSKGKITINMAPYQYMQMYSYGVHLLSAIRKVTNNCEDIQIAVESLKKLLEDMRNPNIDNSTNDTFTDNVQDTSSNIEITNNHDSSSLHEQENLRGYNETEKGCESKSKRRKLNDEEISNPVEFIRNIDIEESFFSSLNIQRVNESATKSNTFGQEVQFDQKQHSTLLPLEEENSQNTSFNVEKGTLSDVTTNQQKVIRKFTICAEFEERLKNKYNSNFYDDELDYEEYYDEYLIEEYCSEDENENVQRNDANMNTADVRIDTADKDSEPESSNAVDPLLINENSKKFKYMMCMLLQEIRTALCQVKILCNQCYEELKNKGGSKVQRCDLQQMAEKAHLHILRLCRSLQSILQQETNHPNQNIRNLLKQADINICDVDDRLLFEYRITVGKCKDHADVFLNSIQNIISAFNN